MQGIIRNSLAAISLALLSGCASDDLGPKYTEVDEEDSRLLFFGPGLAGGYRLFLVGTDERFRKRTTGDYGPYEGEYPNAYLRLLEQPPGRYFTRLRDVRDVVHYWGRFRDAKVEKGPAGDAVNALGPVDFVSITADGVACVVWRQPVGPRATRTAGAMVLDGYYCKGEADMMTADEARAVVQLVGHQDYGEIWPPDDWWRIKGLLFAEIMEFGSYEADGGGGGDATGPDRPAAPPSFAVLNDRISDRPGTAFGMKYVVKGGEEGKKVDVTVRIQHPEMGGRTETQWTSSVRIGEASYAGFRIGPNQQGATGVWTVEVLQKDWVLGGKAFRVVPSR